jgi:hypothetical protein
MIAWVELTAAYGHLDDALALLFAVTALWAAVTARPMTTGLLVGLAIDAKPWALIFLPLLFLASDRTGSADVAGAATEVPAKAQAQARSRALAAGCALAVVIAGWLPFFLADPATMAAAHFTIRNMPDSALRAIGFSTPRTPSWDRSAQIVLAWVLGALALWRKRPAAVIMLAAGARIALDPGTHGVLHRRGDGGGAGVGRHGHAAAVPAVVRAVLLRAQRGPPADRRCRHPGHDQARSRARVHACHAVQPGRLALAAGAERAAKPAARTPGR